MQPFDTSHYTIQRKDSGELVRIDGLGAESPEFSIEYYNPQIEYHEQVVANLQAQKAKVEEFERENPAPEPPVETKEVTEAQ